MTKEEILDKLNDLSIDELEDIKHNVDIILKTKIKKALAEVIEGRVERPNGTTYKTYEYNNKYYQVEKGNIYERIKLEDGKFKQGKKIESFSGNEIKNYIRFHMK